MTIANNDLNESPYTITLTGTGTAPEIDLKQGTTPIASGGSYNYGSRLVGSGGTPVTFTIENNGDGDLNLTGTPKVSLTGSAMFTMGTQPTSPIAPAGTQPFTITFTPTSTGAADGHRDDRQQRPERGQLHLHAHRHGDRSRDRPEAGYHPDRLGGQLQLRQPCWWVLAARR